LAKGEGEDELNQSILYACMKQNNETHWKSFKAGIRVIEG
jgi:hypothetical protein